MGIKSFQSSISQPALLIQHLSDLSDKALQCERLLDELD